MLNVVNVTAEEMKRVGAGHYAAGRFGEALGAFEAAARMAPGSAAARHNVGLGLFGLKRFDEALVEFERAVEMEPRMAVGWNSWGAALLETGRAGEAVKVLREGVRRHPGEAGMHSFLICAMAHADAEWGEIVAETGAYGRRFGEVARPGVRRVEGRGLRVGFVSGDFREHAVAWFLEPLLRGLAGRGVETICYSHGGVADGVTGRLRGLARGWREIGALDDEAAAGVIRGDGVDLLVDLMGHTAGNRLGIFARRPAGVQVSWLGYSGPVALGAIDARLSDGVLDAGEAVEGDRVVRMPVFAAYGARGEVGGEVERRGGAGLRFGCFSNPVKWSRGFLRACSGILERVAGARLMMILPGMDGAAMERVRGQFAEGVRERVEFRHAVGLGEFMEMHREVDVVLDTFPLSGHTVTCHGLWMGVPVVTRAGRTAWQRLSASVLEGMGRREWIAGSAAEYVEIAVRVAGEGAGDRGALRREFEGSRVMDWGGFAEGFERAVREIHAGVAGGDSRGTEGNHG